MNQQNDIIDKITEMLNHTFVDPIKREINVTSERINFACPYCFDSKKDPRKKRGNLYLDDLHFKCFNCGKYTSFIQMLNDFDIGFKFTDDFSRKPMNNQKPIATLDHLVFQDFFVLERSDLLYKIGATEIIDHPKGLKYMKKRKIPEDRYDIFAAIGNNIIIMNLVNWKNHQYVINYNTRTNNPNFRYIITDFKKMNNEYQLGFDVEDKMFQIFERVASVFNIFNVDIQEMVTVFEGEFDAVSFPGGNTIALSGISKNAGIKLPKKRFVFDNDEEGKKKTINLIKQGESVFLWRKFIQKFKLQEFKLKDMNDLRIVFSGQGMDINGIDFNEFFSDNQLDVIFL